MRFLSLLTLCVFTFILTNAQNVGELEQFEKAMKPGTTLSYDVKQGGKSFQLVVTLKKVGAEFAFDWKTSAPSNQSGSVSMSANAVAKSDALLHTFAGGELKLEKEMSLFLSKKIEDDVMANAGAMFKVMGASDTLTNMSNTISDVGFMLNGEFVTVPGWELEGGSDIKYLVGVIESAKFPLIYRLDTGWTLLLTEVKSQ